MNKEEIKMALSKKPNELSKAQLLELFGIFCLNIKEYRIVREYLTFEIHFRCIYLIRVVYPIKRGPMSFENEFIDFEEESDGVAMQRAQNTGELIRVFINMFYSTLLKDAGYEVRYNERTSWYNSLAEAKEYFEYAKGLI